MKERCVCKLYKKLSYRRETARQLWTSFSASSLIVHFTEHLSYSHVCSAPKSTIGRPRQACRP